MILAVELERASANSHFLVYENGYYGPEDGGIIYEGPSLLRAAKVAAKHVGGYGTQVAYPRHLDEAWGLSPRMIEIIAWADYNEYKRREREKAKGK